jgi:hypothetical protein
MQRKSAKNFMQVIEGFASLREFLCGFAWNVLKFLLKFYLNNGGFFSSHSLAS